MKNYRLTDFPEGAIITGINGQISWYILGPDGRTEIYSEGGHNSRSEALKKARRWRRENFNFVVSSYEAKTR